MPQGVEHRELEPDDLDGLFHVIRSSMPQGVEHLPQVKISLFNLE
jgi:hypothetical protein